MKLFRVNVFLLLILKSFGSFAQGATITGEVKPEKANVNLRNALVFLNQTSFYTVADQSNKFSLKDIPTGFHTLTVVCPGYEICKKSVWVENDKQKLDIDLLLKEKHSEQYATQAQSRKDLQLFHESFGKRRKDLNILNPEKLHLAVSGNMLKASTNDFLVLNNDYLGYEMKIMLTKFEQELSPGNEDLKFDGAVLFSDLKGSASAEKVWKSNRLKAYNGSALHFYRALISNNLKAEGFSIFPLISRLNSKRASDSLINAKLTQFKNQGSANNAADSLRYWQNQQALPIYNHVVYRDSMKATDVLSRNSQGLYTLKSPYKIYVKYTHPDAEAKAMVNNSFFDFHQPLNEVSVIVEFKKDAVLIDRNGVLQNADEVTYTGGWDPKPGEILPLNYIPEN